VRTDIKNPWIRRPLLVFTVAAIVVCLGPLHLIQATLRWVEWEFEVNLRAVWRGPK
jgi:hypothetical protein